jgi:cyclophilin family peptidyl-prolyl cis-trans isomerase
MAFAGTVVTYGRGRAVVVATGTGTEFGRIAQLLETVEQERTPLQENLDRVGHTLAPEFSAIRHARGSVPMARADNPNSASTSFFLGFGPSPHLNGNYSRFGREGLEGLDIFNKEKVSGETPKRALEMIEARIDPL